MERPPFLPELMGYVALHIPFLTARWSNLAILTYAVPPRVLEPHLPAGCHLDMRDGRAFVSLVAFDFLDTRVLGVPWPGFRNFPEINLRFYVRHGDDRGVCFLREFVPQRFLAWVARTLYNEPYLASPMSSRIEENSAQITTRHILTVGGREHKVCVTGQKPSIRPPSDSIEHFFKEHRWGFGRTRGGRLLRYEVVHPTWDVYLVRSVDLDWNWALVYGNKWAFLEEAPLYSSVLAVGSEVRVYPRRTVSA